MGRGGLGGARLGGAVRGGAGQRQFGAPRRQLTILPSSAPKTTVLNIHSEARNNEILCKPNGGTRRAVDKQFINRTTNTVRSWLWPMDRRLCCLCKPWSCRAYRGTQQRSAQVAATNRLPSAGHNARYLFLLICYISSPSRVAQDMCFRHLGGRNGRSLGHRADQNRIGGMSEFWKQQLQATIALPIYYLNPSTP